MTKKEKFLALVSKEKTNSLEKNRERIKNRAMLRESQQIAIKVLKRLDELEWSQKKLSTMLGVTPQQITKIVSGQENLTIETQVKLQELLNIPILASFYEKQERHLRELILNLDKKIEHYEAVAKKIPHNYRVAKRIKIVHPALQMESFKLTAS